MVVHCYRLDQERDELLKVRPEWIRTLQSSKSIHLCSKKPNLWTMVCFRHQHYLRYVFVPFVYIVSVSVSMWNLRFLCSLCINFTCTSLLQGVDGSGPYGPNPDLDRPPMDESGIGPDPSGPDSGKSSHPMASGKDALMLQIVTSCILLFFLFDK